MLVIVCSLIAIGAIGFTLVLRDRDIPPAPVENPEMKHLEARRLVLYENLKDLQFEFHQGKLSDLDYQSLKQGFLIDLAGVMDEMERLPAKQSKAEQSRIAKEAFGRKRSKAEHAGTAVAVQQAPAAEGEISCASCGATNAAANRFCGQCGKPLS